jgi:hypothetical protein
MIKAAQSDEPKVNQCQIKSKAQMPKNFLQLLAPAGSFDIRNFFEIWILTSEIQAFEKIYFLNFSG